MNNTGNGSDQFIVNWSRTTGHAANKSQGIGSKTDGHTGFFVRTDAADFNFTGHKKTVGKDGSVNLAKSELLFQQYLHIVRKVFKYLLIIAHIAFHANISIALMGFDNGLIIFVTG